MLITVDQLEARSNEDPRARIRFQLLMLPFRSPTYDQFADLVETSLVFSAEGIVKNPGLHKDMSEDQLTNIICGNLNAYGFDASFNSMVGGHVDVTIKTSGGYLWLGEAKIHSDYAWLAKGYNQLTTRYATGQPGQTSGGMIIYIRQPRIDQVMDEWKTVLQTEVAEIRIQDSDRCAAAFHSVAPNIRTGADFRAFHFPMSIYHQPDDARKSVRKRAAKKVTKRTAIRKSG